MTMDASANRPVREPAVAGAFYPGLPAQLRQTVERLLVRMEEPVSPLALLVPHAGYVYSGATAGKAYASSNLPNRLIILCPNHTGLGAPLSCMDRGSWRTPLGDVPLDANLASALLGACPDVRVDPTAHLREHSIEVQLPFLQTYLEGFRFVPLAVGMQDYDSLAKLGLGLAEVLRAHGGEAAILVSTDMNHYESASENRRKDDLALNAVKALDARALHEVCLRERISMCGFAPTVSAIVAARACGANRADVVDYTHSGLITGDDQQVVSYAAVRIWKDAS